VKYYYYNVTFVGLYFSLVTQVKSESVLNEATAIEMGRALIDDSYGWDIQQHSHEVLVEEDKN